MFLNQNNYFCEIRITVNLFDFWIPLNSQNSICFSDRTSANFIHKVKNFFTKLFVSLESPNVNKQFNEEIPEHCDESSSRSLDWVSILLGTYRILLSHFTLSAGCNRDGAVSKYLRAIYELPFEVWISILKTLWSFPIRDAIFKSFPSRSLILRLINLRRMRGFCLFTWLNH